MLDEDDSFVCNFMYTQMYDCKLYSKINHISKEPMLTIKKDVKPSFNFDLVGSYLWVWLSRCSQLPEAG